MDRFKGRKLGRNVLPKNLVRNVVLPKWDKNEPGIITVVSLNMKNIRAINVNDPGYAPNQFADCMSKNQR